MSDGPLRYWRANRILIAVLLSIWALVSFVFAIFLAIPLNSVRVGQVPMSFWWAHQGSMFVFVLLIFVAVLVAGFFGIYPPAFVAQVVAYAFGLAAASFFPIILLGIFDKRTNKAGAIAGMSVGLLFTLFYISANKYFGMEPWFNISSEGIGTVGMFLNLIVTLVVSRLTPPPPIEIQEMVESVRVPRGARAAMEAH